MQLPKLQIIRKSSFKATPWKNGGGITHEAMRVPANADPFRWRVSVANIDASGPFSNFAAYKRILVLLRGAGIRLNLAGGDQGILRQAGDLLQFDGAVFAYCELLDGPCVDLNLMVLKSVPVDARVLRFSESVPVRASCDESTLIFCIGESAVLEIGTGETVTLEPWDLAVLSHTGARIAGPAPGCVFVASVGN